MARQPRVVVNGSGVATVAWQDERADRVRALRWSAGGGAGEHVDVSAAGGQLALGEVAMDAAGDAVAVWRRDDGADAIAQAAGYDAAGPSIRGLSVPPTATVGEPVAFAVDPFDVWSIAAAGFDFGDGTSAPGTPTRHVYGAPGPTW